MAFKINLSDPKTGKSFQKEADAQGLVGKNIGDKIAGGLVDLAGYELEITGGSDRVGNPMRKDIMGPAPKRLLLGDSVGYHPEKRGMRKKKRVHGKTVASDIVQINMKVLKEGSTPLAKLFGKEEKPAEAAPKTETPKPKVEAKA